MPNKLISEQSPYLLQHAHNPVDWHPWGDAAFEQAKNAHKPVLVSIGYAACHWCHVMERESFEDEAVAAYMNEHFVCIKVDREEHPDVDHMYMDAVQAIGGSGGWPLNVFVTPERAPFYGGTYFPPRPAYSRPSWMQLLQRMAEVWNEHQDEVTLQADQLIQHLSQASQKSFTGGKAAIDRELCGKMAESLLKQADTEKGGFGNAPKFPGTMAISFLLEYYHFTGHEPSLRHALQSLDAMIEGGIYDQLAGGFARYATDRDWLVPHFEKMLYDNALLICSLCDAYSITKNARYRKIIGETIAFVEAELKDKSGGYYCAIDADSEGVEGKFYTWTWQEWIYAVGHKNEYAAQHFGVRPGGNWEGTNILHIAKSTEEIAAENNVAVDVVGRSIDEAKNSLLEERAKRIRPLTDDKSLLSWNALMNIALSRAGVCLAQKKYLDRAEEHANWMLNNFRIDDELRHVWKQGVAKIAAKLDDYAYLAQALLTLAAATARPDRVLQAADLIDEAINEFGNGEEFFYYSAAKQNDIPVRKIDLYDGATPSANAVMAHNLLIAGMCMERGEWIERAGRMLGNMADTAVRYSYSFGYWAILIQRKVYGLKIAVCSGSEADEYRSMIEARFIPQLYVLTSKKEICELPVMEKKFFGGKFRIFVCTEQACLSPVTSVEEAFQLIMS
jgi:uncharacterized protein